MADNPDEVEKNHIISWRRIREFLEAHPEDPSAVKVFETWYNTAEKTPFRHFGDVKKTFGAADLVGEVIVFNVGGNKYRLVDRFHYENRVILVKHVLTHREYDSGKWKG